MVVFAAQLEVAHDNGDLRAGDQQDDEHQEEEAEHVVELMLPDGREDEEQLNEHRAEGQNTSHQDSD